MSKRGLAAYRNRKIFVATLLETFLKSNSVSKVLANLLLRGRVETFFLYHTAKSLLVTRVRLVDMC